MAVFNNLVLFDQTKPLNSTETIVPELAASWSWDAGNTKLTMKLREGVKWHDGKPFTAKDVQCTWHALIGKSGQQEFNRNPRKVWYYNLQGRSRPTATTRSPSTSSQRQPSFLMLLAAGFSPVYPCHVSSSDMRTKPVGTGPFKFCRCLSATCRSSWCATRTIGRRASPTSMPSRCASSTAVRRASWRSYPANST